MITRLLAAAAAAFVAVAAALAGGASAPGTIVFAVDWPQGLDWGANAADATVELCAVTTGGHAFRLTVSEPGVALVDPAWGPGGATLAATAGVAGVSGTAVAFRRVGGRPAAPSISGAEHPSFSPDGTSVAFDVAAPDGSGRRIATAAVGGAQRVLVTSGPGSDTYPAWSPDGSWIAFSSTRDGGRPQLYVVHPDGTGLRRVTQSAAADSQPRWSPDGATLLLTTIAAGRATLATVALDGSGRRSLGIASGDAVFSPDGRSLAYVLGDGRVQIARADGAAARTVYAGAEAGAGIDWRPAPQAAAAAGRPCVIRGSPGVRTLAGSRFGDAIVGGPGGESIRGLGGDDVVFGGGGGDRIDAGPGNDQVDGGAGDDRIVGGPGRDVLHGGAGDDTILARDGARDTIACGPGHDAVVADRLDRVSRDCERVQRRWAGSGRRRRDRASRR